MAGHCLEVGSDKNPVLTRCESEQIGERKSIGSRRRHPVTIASWRLASARKRIIRQLRRERVCCRIRSNCIVTSGFVGRALLKAQHRIMRPNSLGGLPELKFSHDLDQGHTTSTSPSLRPRASQGSRISPAYELFCIIELRRLMAQIELLSVVALVDAIPDRGLVQGQVGTVVADLAPDDSGQTYASLVLRTEQLISDVLSAPSPFNQRPSPIPFLPAMLFPVRITAWRLFPPTLGPLVRTTIPILIPGDPYIPATRGRWTPLNNRSRRPNANHDFSRGGSSQCQDKKQFCKYSVHHTDPLACVGPQCKTMQDHARQ